MMQTASPEVSAKPARIRSPRPLPAGVAANFTRASVRQSSSSIARVSGSVRSSCAMLSSQWGLACARIEAIASARNGSRVAPSAMTTDIGGRDASSLDKFLIRSASASDSRSYCSTHRRYSLPTTSAECGAGPPDPCGRRSGLSAAQATGRTASRRGGLPPGNDDIEYAPDRIARQGRTSDKALPLARFVVPGEDIADECEPILPAPQKRQRVVNLRVERIGDDRHRLAEASRIERDCRRCGYDPDRVLYESRRGEWLPIGMGRVDDDEIARCRKWPAIALRQPASGMMRLHDEIDFRVRSEHGFQIGAETGDEFVVVAVPMEVFEDRDVAAPGERKRRPHGGRLHALRAPDRHAFLPVLLGRHLGQTAFIAPNEHPIRCEPNLSVMLVIEVGEADILDPVLERIGPDLLLARRQNDRVRDAMGSFRCLARRQNGIARG